MHITVRDGTNAGWKRMNEKTIPWMCAICSKESKYRLCIGCGAAKPEE